MRLMIMTLALMIGCGDKDGDTAEEVDCTEENEETEETEEVEEVEEEDTSVEE